MTNTPKILVTGAGGTVGTALRGELGGAQPAARLAFRSPEKAAKARAEGAEAFALDFAAPETLRPALEGVDAVFLLGAGGRGQREGETNVVQAARAAGVKKIVKLSVWDAETEAFELAKIHRAVERAIEDSGLAFTFLRANGFMQNFTNHLAGSIKGGVIYQPAAEAKISHVDVRDIARVAARALGGPGLEGRALDLSGPEALSYGEISARLSRALGRPVNYVALSDEAARAGMISAGMPDFYADYLVDLYRYYRGGAGARVSNAVADVIGRAPVAFDQFLRDYAGAFR